MPLWAIFKQQSAKYFNPSRPRPQNNLNSTKSISRRISRFLEQENVSPVEVFVSLESVLSLFASLAGLDPGLADSDLLVDFRGPVREVSKMVQNLFYFFLGGYLIRERFGA